MFAKSKGNYNLELKAGHKGREKNKRQLYKLM